MQIASPHFAPHDEIPRLHTRDGEDIAPALCWTGVPARAKSLALIVDDPDAPDPAAPGHACVHWLVYDIPPTAFGLPEGGKPLPQGAREGVNHRHRPGWDAPCPPVGRHHCVFRLYALDVVLPVLPPEADKAALEAQMRGHVLEHAELVGTRRAQGR
jgi:Raf kinase inhibitor-like YbhB/YbcL family protein